MLTFASKRRPWAFIMPLGALGVGRAAGDEVTQPGDLLVVVVVGLVCGVAWQLLYRRDLVDRLTYFAAFFVVSMGLMVVLPEAEIGSAPLGSTVALCGVLAGLIYTEQWLRSRAERAANLRSGATQR
ncbi:hypothetical protein [Nocardioides antri]|uniref:Uncharacterized protein n=1 Tax=Nocardioides antri TaxID=2607659 RepID=A0A5B1LRY9_9ACTN|nr:hypothetical protein [Nocardioides antri]KAA1423174.1 hypothetical protein F0U47_20250 [Nocardioides antri]